MYLGTHKLSSIQDVETQSSTMNGGLDNFGDEAKGSALLNKPPSFVLHEKAYVVGFHISLL